MLNWIEITANAAWIFAVALEMAVVSFAYWERNTSGQTLRMVLSRPPMFITLTIAGGIFFLGLAASLPAIWEKILLLVLAGFCIVQIWRDVRSYKAERLPNLKNKEDE